LVKVTGEKVVPNQALYLAIAPIDEVKMKVKIFQLFVFGLANVLL
jgi:hypothetical protein